MFDFLRKYQKIFFFLIAALIIFSIVFFGTFSTFIDQVPTAKDRVIGQAIDGSEMKLFEIEALSRFLASDREERGAFNPLNDGVIRHDLLQTKIAEKIVEKSLPFLKAALEEKLQRAKTYRSYEHPQAPFVSAKAIWEKASPLMNRQWSSLKTLKEPSVEVFSHLSSLYQLQSALPPELLRRFLLMQEREYNWVNPDPRLRQEDLSLFGFHSMSDWFGKDFIDLMAEFIHNVAIHAEKKGHLVTMAEAKEDLKRVFAESMKDKPSIRITYQEAIRHLGLDETQAVGIWRKVLLFRRSFKELSHSLLMDPLPYAEFARVATEKVLIDRYSFLAPKTSLETLAFDLYLKAVSPSTDFLNPVSAIFPLEHIEKKVPELTFTRYKAKVFAIDKREAALKAPLKELWDFETEEATWKLLKKEFALLQTLPSATIEERFQSLETISPEIRGKIDFFARRLLIEKHPEWISQALLQSKGEEKELVLSAGSIHLPYLQEPKRLGSLFEEILTAPEKALQELQYFACKDAVFRFENIAKVSDKMVKSFAQAYQDGSLNLLLNQTLEKEFPKLKAKLPQDKKDKPFAEVKEDLASLFVDKKRFVSLADRAKQAFVQGDQTWLCQPNEGPLLAQFKWQKKEEEISRTAKEDWMVKEAFSLQPKEWSSIHVDPEGMVSYFFTKEKKASDEKLTPQIQLGQQILAQDVQRLMAQKLLEKMEFVPLHKH